MAIIELFDYGVIGFKLAEAGLCAIGSIFVSNWRMSYWNVPVFTLLVASTIGYVLISIVLIFVGMSGKPHYFVSVVFTGLGSALNFMSATLMVLRIFVFQKKETQYGKPYYYVSEGMLTFWMYVCSITMFLDVACNSPPNVIETHSSTDDEDEDEDGVRRKSRYTETTLDAL